MITQGLFDLQVNGYAGVDFNDPDIGATDVDHALEHMLADGVTGCLPTIITAHDAELVERFHTLDCAVAASRLGPQMVPGYHLEGPWLNAGEGYRGCHPAEAMTDPRPALIEEIEHTLSRPVLLVTLAPERAGALAAVKALRAAGRTVSIGHSAAGVEQVKGAADAGVSLSTHLGNGLPPQLPKLGNTLLAQLAEPRLTACLIADGHHMAAEDLAALVSIKGKDNCILVSDAVVAAAADPGTYVFAGMQVAASAHGRVTQPGGAGLAGSALRLHQAVRNLVDWKIAQPEEAVRMASRHARDAIARSLASFRISMDPGELRWTSDLCPHVTATASIG